MWAEGQICGVKQPILLLERHGDTLLGAIEHNDLVRLVLCAQRALGKVHELH